MCIYNTHNIPVFVLLLMTMIFLKWTPYILHKLAEVCMYMCEFVYALCTEHNEYFSLIFGFLSFSLSFFSDLRLDLLGLIVFGCWKRVPWCWLTMFTRGVIQIRVCTVGAENESTSIIQDDEGRWTHTACEMLTLNLCRTNAILNVLFWVIKHLQDTVPCIYLFIIWQILIVFFCREPRKLLRKCFGLFNKYFHSKFFMEAVEF